jgi:hypothetical protein
MKLNDILKEDYRNEFGPPDEYYDDTPSEDEFSSLRSIIDEFDLPAEIEDMTYIDNNRKGVDFNHNKISFGGMFDELCYHNDRYDEIHAAIANTGGGADNLKAVIEDMYKNGLLGDSPQELMKNW